MVAIDIRKYSACLSGPIEAASVEGVIAALYQEVSMDKIVSNFSIKLAPVPRAYG
jgi:hypothetical protein